MSEKKNGTYVCRKIRLCDWLRMNGFEPYRVAEDRYNPGQTVFLFSRTRELEESVMDFLRGTDKPRPDFPAVRKGDMI